jgi:hypothetical protein
MRNGTGVLAAVIVSIALTTSACGSPESPDPAPNLFGDYVRSTTVVNDRFAGTGGSSEDRMANFAAYYTPEQLQARLLSAFPCDTSAPDDSGRGGDFFDTHCDLTGTVLDGVRRVGGSDDKVAGRVVLVKREDGSLELLTLLVAAGRLIDADGKTYDGLNDFRENNDLLSPDDVMLAPRNLTAVPGEGEVVTVYGHTRSTWHLWALGGIVVVLLGVALLVALRRAATRSRRAPAPTDQAPPGF